jgi:hypothetical protein
MNQEEIVHRESRNGNERRRESPTAGQESSFEVVLACGAGAGILGGYFGDVGIFVGAVIGGLFGYYYSKHSHAC